MPLLTPTRTDNDKRKVHPMSVLAIDQGTTSTRAMILDGQGEARIVHVASHRQHYPAPGWVEHDPEELIANIHRCIEAAGEIAAIGLDNQGESCLAWNAETKEEPIRLEAAPPCQGRDTCQRVGIASSEASLHHTRLFRTGSNAWICQPIDLRDRAL